MDGCPFRFAFKSEFNSNKINLIQSFKSFNSNKIKLEDVKAILTLSIFFLVEVINILHRI